MSVQHHKTTIWTYSFFTFLPHSLKYVNVLYNTDGFQVNSVC
jgi:hypothetical protein